LHGRAAEPGRHVGEAARQRCLAVADRGLVGVTRGRLCWIAEVLHGDIGPDQPATLVAAEAGACRQAAHQEQPPPCSAEGSSTTRGSDGPPQSATATLTIDSCQVISVANQPPRPLAVCLIVLPANSLATVITSSLAGRSGRNEASHCRIRPTWRSSPGKTRRHLKPGTSAGGALGVPGPCSGPSLVAGMLPPRPRQYAGLAGWLAGRLAVAARRLPYGFRDIRTIIVRGIFRQTFV